MYSYRIYAYWIIRVRIDRLSYIQIDRFGPETKFVSCYLKHIKKRNVEMCIKIFIPQKQCFGILVIVSEARRLSNKVLET